jgi:hypothetical protein
MGQVVEVGPTRETESGEETLRVTAVETAWRLIRRHPNWIRHYGFSVGEAWGPEFVDSLQELKAIVEARVERQRSREFASGRQPALPDTLDAILTAVFLLRCGRRPVRPIPSGIGATWRALLPFCVLETSAEWSAEIASSAGVSPVSPVLEGEGWCVDLEQLSRPREIH